MREPGDIVIFAYRICSAERHACRSAPLPMILACESKRHQAALIGLTPRMARLKSNPVATAGLRQLPEVERMGLGLTALEKECGAVYDHASVDDCVPGSR